jgi:endonuclease YncB( thermonuclease family)
VLSDGYNDRRGKLFVTITLFMLFPLAVFADIAGKVVGVSDGDTITVLDSSKGLTKIRLHQIDAPKNKQVFGQRSKQIPLRSGLRQAGPH